MEEKSDLAVGRIPDASFANDFRTSAGRAGTGEDDSEIEDAIDGRSEHVLEILFRLGFLGVWWARPGVW